jgi:hypothetical protein
LVSGILTKSLIGLSETKLSCLATSANLFRIATSYHTSVIVLETKYSGKSRTSFIAILSSLVKSRQTLL